MKKKKKKTVEISVGVRVWINRSLARTQWRVFWRATQCASSFELSIDRIVPGNDLCDERTKRTSILILGRRLAVAENGALFAWGAGFSVRIRACFSALKCANARSVTLSRRSVYREDLERALNALSSERRSRESRFSQNIHHRRVTPVATRERERERERESSFNALILAKPTLRPFTKGAGVATGHRTTTPVRRPKRVDRVEGGDDMPPVACCAARLDRAKQLSSGLLRRDAREATTRERRSKPPFLTTVGLS